MVRYTKRGGLRFLQIGRLTVSWSVAKERKDDQIKAFERDQARKARKEQQARSYLKGFNSGFDMGFAARRW